MIWDLFLLGVLIGAGYWGIFFVRQQPYGTATFGLMQLGAAALSGLGLLGRKFDAAWLGIAGAIGVGAGVCLLVIGPVARMLARRLAAAERLAIATRLLDVAELLGPGSGVAEERALVQAMAEIREGKIEQTILALNAARERASGEARLAIDERIAMLYLAAYRWTDAIAHAEANLLPTPAATGDESSLRRQLGMAPPVWVDLLGAYGRVGDLDRAARMLVRLEDVCAGRDEAALWIHRGRMMFLALAGRVDAVRTLITPRRARHMTPAARSYWLAVALEHRGDRAAATEAYEKARARSRGRPRALIEQAMAGVARSRRVEPGAVASEVVARVEAAPPPPPVRITRPRRVHAAWTLAAILIAVAAITRATLGNTWDSGVLVRSGAVVHGMVADGEWWRVVSALFVHVGAGHLWLNVFGMLVLGWLAEDLFGPSRTTAIFAVAGLAGALASYAAAPAGISAGASGALFGVLGALFVELTWHRERYRVAWKRGMWGALAVITVGQLAFGFLFPVIDQWAHGAGLVAGAVLGIALSPSARWARIGLQVGRVIAAGFAAIAVIAWVLVIETPLSDSLGRGGIAPRVSRDAGVVVHAPASWLASTEKAMGPGHQVVRIYGTIAQPEGLVLATFSRAPGTALAGELDRWSDEQRTRFKEFLGELRDTTAQPVALPAGWVGREIRGGFDDDMEYRQRIVMTVCGRVFGDQVILVAILAPETIATGAPEFFARLLASIGPA